MDEKFMRAAIEKAKKGIAKGQAPFGACIVKDGRIVSCEHNTVWKTTDSTAHAEMNAIRRACKKLKTIDLSGCDIYSTCEPCPMCFCACHWAKISNIYFGASISDAQKAGFHELPISDKKLDELGNSPLEVFPGVMKEECLELFEMCKKAKLKTY